MAYAHGPNYNFHADVGYYDFSITPDIPYPNQKKAVAALARASELVQAHAAATAAVVAAEGDGEKGGEGAAGGGLGDNYEYLPVEIALVEAQRIRFATHPWPAKIHPHVNIAYANAMKEVLAEFPDDPEVAFACTLTMDAFIPPRGY